MSEPTLVSWIQIFHWILSVIRLSIVSCLSHLCPPAENVWWHDLNLLSLSPFSSGMWDEQWNRRTSLCHQSSEWLSRFYSEVCNFCTKERTLCISTLLWGYNKPTYEQIQSICKFAWGKDVASCFSANLTTEIWKFAAPLLAIDASMLRECCWLHNS